MQSGGHPQICTLPLVIEECAHCAQLHMTLSNAVLRRRSGGGMRGTAHMGGWTYQQIDLNSASGGILVDLFMDIAIGSISFIIELRFREYVRSLLGSSNAVLIAV